MRESMAERVAEVLRTLEGVERDFETLEGEPYFKEWRAELRYAIISAQRIWYHLTGEAWVRGTFDEVLDGAMDHTRDVAAAVAFEQKMTRKD